MMRLTIICVACFLLVAVTLAEPKNKAAKEESTRSRIKKNAPLPGRGKSFGRVCQELGKDGVCWKEDSGEHCKDLICADGRSDIATPVKSGQAPEGTECGHGQICVNGACVKDTDPPIPYIQIIDFQYVCKAT